MPLTDIVVFFCFSLKLEGFYLSFNDLFQSEWTWSFLTVIFADLFCFGFFFNRVLNYSLDFIFGPCAHTHTASKSSAPLQHFRGDTEQGNREKTPCLRPIIPSK